MVMMTTMTGDVVMITLMVMTNDNDRWGVVVVSLMCVAAECDQG